MHVFTRAITALKTDMRTAEAAMHGAKNPMHRQLYRGRMLGLRRAIELLQKERSRKMDELSELVAKG